MLGNIATLCSPRRQALDDTMLGPEHDLLEHLVGHWLGRRLDTIRVGHLAHARNYDSLDLSGFGAHASDFAGEK
jgi:hypothetical protein